MIHPGHVEQAASERVEVVLLGLGARTEQTAGASLAVAAADALVVFRALVADAHAARADGGRRPVEQVPLMRLGPSVKEIKCT